jgi:hypothetical protein
MAKAKKAAKKISVKKVKLPRTGALQIVAPPDIIPIVVHKEPGVITIKPVQASGGWWRDLFFGK